MTERLTRERDWMRWKCLSGVCSLTFSSGIITHRHSFPPTDARLNVTTAQEMWLPAITKVRTCVWECVNTSAAWLKDFQSPLAKSLFHSLDTFCSTEERQRDFTVRLCLNQKNLLQTWYPTNSFSVSVPHILTYGFGQVPDTVDVFDLCPHSQRLSRSMHGHIGINPKLPLCERRERGIWWESL